MTIAGRLLLLLLLFALAAPAIGGDGDEEEKLAEARAKWERLTEEQRQRILAAWERWKRLSVDQRRHRERVFEEPLKGSTPRELRELADKLDQVGRQRNLAELRRKQERMQGFVAKFEGSLAEEVRAKLDALPDDKHEAVLTFAVARMSEVFVGRLMEGLPPPERERVLGFQGRERMDRLWESHIRRVRDRLTEEERKELDALPEDERRMRLFRLVGEMFQEDRRIARETVGAEVAAILDLPPKEMEERLRAPRILGVLRELGVEGDHDLARRLSQLRWDQLQISLGRLRAVLAIENVRERRRALEDYRLNLGLPNEEAGED